MSDLRDLRFCLSGGERVGWTGSADFIQIAASRHENVKVTSTVRGALASMLGYRTTRPPRMGGVTIFRTSPSLPLVSNRTCTWLCALSASAHGHVAFRRGTQADASIISRMTAKESMNPLGLKPERFVVAVDQNEMMLGFGQLQPYGDPDRATFHELRTLIVDPAHRGKGVGSELVRKLLEAAQATDVFLTTLEQSIPFYAPHGFQRIRLSAAPRSLWFEIAAGLVVARIVAQDQLVVLKRPA